MKKLFSVCFLLCYISMMCTFGQTDVKEDTLARFKFAVGVGAGFSTGYGLSYRYTPCKFGLQLNFAPYQTRETARYSTGLTFLYTLIESKTANLFLYQGNHYFYNSETWFYLDSTKSVQVTNDLSTGYSRKNIEEYFINGIGIGIEIIIVKRVSFNLMAGYAAYRNFREVNFTGETGLYYRF